VSDQYERYHQRALNSLKALKTWKNLRAGSEFGGLALAFGTYLLTPNFWAFLSVAIAIAAVYFLLQAQERKAYRVVKADYAEVSDATVSQTLEPDEREELQRLFERAVREMKVK